MTRTLPTRRLLAVAAALALFGGQAEAMGGKAPHRASTLDGNLPVCPLGAFNCPPRPYNYAMCRPNAMLSFYDPALSRDASQRETSKAYVTARHVDSSDQAIYRLSGDVRLQRADQQLQANAIDYNDASTAYDARGQVRYQDAGQLLSAAHIRGNNAASTGLASDVSYQLLDSRGNGTASQAQMFDAERTRYTQASYSTCDVGHHVWEFRGQSISVDKASGVGVARHASLRIGNVPILYLPYFSFPVDDRRKSGFLYPTIGHSSRSGYMASAPYYLNLAPNYDATLEPRYYSLRGPMLGGEFRYLTPGSRGSLSAQYLTRDRGPNDSNTTTDTHDQRRYLIHLQNSTRLWPGWSLRSSINRSSDNNFLYDFGDQLDDNRAYNLSSSVSVNGGGKWWSAALGGGVYQNMNPFAQDSSLPYRQLPYATLSLNLPLTRWLQFGMDNEFVAFRKSGYIEGQREDIQPWLAADFGTPAWFVRPRVAWRYTAYQLGDNHLNYGYYGLLSRGVASPFTRQSPDRSLPIVSVDSGLVFDRDASLFGKHYTQTLEPRLFYLYVPYRNQDALPLFNTTRMSFDYWQLFSTNQYSGADRQMNANNLTAALSTRLLDEGGVERLSASIGQIRYFTPQRVQLPNGATTVAPATDWLRSAYVAQLDLRLSDRWRAASTYQWSPNTRRAEMGMLQLQGRLGLDGVVNFAYRYRRGLLEQYSTSVVYPIAGRWRLIAAGAWSVPDRTAVEALAGIEYDSCCVTLRLVDRNHVNLGYSGFRPPSSPGGRPVRDNTIMFEVVFKGLGASGGQIDALLHRDILGYQ